MLDERAQYLINAELDGALEDGERDELESILETSAEARALREELNKLATLLDAVPDREPPADLAGRIMEQIRVPRRTSYSPGRFFAAFQPAPTAAAFAAGVLAAFALYELTWRDRPVSDVSNMVGAIIAHREPAVAVNRDRVDWSAPGLAGSASLSLQGELIVLDVELVSEQQAEIVFAMREAGVQFGGIAQAAAGTAGGEYYEISGGTLRVECQGQRAFSVFLRQAANRKGQDREISVTVSSAGAPVYSGVLRG